MAERLALPTSDHGVAGSNPAGGEILPEPKRCFVAQSLSYSPVHRLEMNEILLKGRKTLTHPSILMYTLLLPRYYYTGSVEVSLYCPTLSVLLIFFSVPQVNEWQGDLLHVWDLILT